MTRIVTSTYRYKRPPRKKKPVLIEVPGDRDEARAAAAGQRTEVGGASQR